MSLPETYTALHMKNKELGAEITQVPLQKPGKNQVLVQIAFSPINPSDIGAIRAKYTVDPEQPELIGWEGSGTIAALGEDLNVPHKVGDKVHVIGPGTYAQYVVVKSENCVPIKGDLSLEEASCHFVNPVTVLYMVALIERGEHKAAIHTAGSSALGRMLIRLCKHKGIKLINIVRNDAYIEELKKEGADYVLNSKGEGFEEKLKEIAHKEGATIAFDAIGGDFTDIVVKSQPPRSVCYSYGGFVALSGDPFLKVGSMSLIGNKALKFLYFLDFVDEYVEKGKMGQLFDEVRDLLPNILNSHIQKTFKLEEFKEAIDYHKENSSKGKILFKPN